MRSSVPLLDSLLQDARFGLRMLRKSPGFTAVAVLTLALGIGANTAIFSVVEAVLIRPLPFKNPDRLALLTEYKPGKVDRAGISYPDYVAWTEQNHVFDETAAFWKTGAIDDLVLGTSASAERVQYSVVTNTFFSILGVQPKLGRGFTSQDQQPGSAKIFLASNALWHRVLGASPDALGKPYLLDGEVYTLAGVMPEDFDFPQGCDAWLPTSAIGESGMNDRISHPFWVLGRLKPGATVPQARNQINVIQTQLALAFPKTDADWRVAILPLRDEFVGSARTSLLVLLGAAGFILLIACANVVNLMLGRASARQKEFAMRRALGAGQARLAQQALTESLLVAAFSTALALVLANLSIRALGAVHFGRMPPMGAFHLNGPVLAFSASLALLTTILVGLAPALQLSDVRFRESLADGSRGGTSLHTQRVRNALVVCEVALTLALLCGAGLMVKSLYELRRIDPGFRSDHIVTMKIALPSAQYPRGAQTTVFLDRLLEKLQALPGVQTAAVTNTLPLSGESNWDTFIIAGQIPNWAQASSAEWRSISPDYFQAMSIPLLRGREFTTKDQRTQSSVIIINEAMAQRFWPGTDPIGQRVMRIDDQPSSREIIGVVANVKSFGLDAGNPPEMYTPYRAAWYTNVVLRSSLSPAVLFSSARGEVAALDKGVAVYSPSTMDELLSRSVGPRRFNLALLGIFAALALALAAVGIYGVLAFGVSRRRHEIGIRIALGALPRQILQLIVWQGMRLVLFGMLLGVLASLALTRIMSSLLFGVNSADWLTFACVTLLLVAVALASCCIPARRAMRVDPMVALRYE